MDTVMVDTERQVQGSTETVLRTVQSALQQMAFAVDKSQSGWIEAHRGSALRAGMSPEQRPLHISVSVMGHGDAARVHVHLADADPLSTNPQALVPNYQPLFGEVLGDLDGWLLALDPAMAIPAPPAVEVRTGGPSYARSRAASLARHLPGHYGKSTAQALQPEVPVWVVAPDATAVLNPDQTQMLLTVASMAASSDLLPAAHARRVEDLDLALQRPAQSARPPYERLDICDVDKQALDFLNKQALIRQGLPVREVRRCRDCGYEKVVNPDYRKQMQHNQTLQQLTGMVGVTVGSSGSNLFLLAGRLLNLNQLRAKAIPCARCEGTDADVSLATICPKCREIRKEPILRICPNKACGYNFLQRVAGESLWSTPAVAPTPTPLPVSAAAAPAVLAPAVGGPDTADPPGEPEPAMDSAAPAGWYDDPSGRHELRYFDGDWTEWAADDGVTVEDPLD